MDQFKIPESNVVIISQGGPLSPAKGGGSHTGLYRHGKKNQTNPPTLPSPTPVFPGPLLLLPMTKHCARPKQKHRDSRPVKLLPDPTASLLALERRDKRRPTIGRSPPQPLALERSS